MFIGYSTGKYLSFTKSFKGNRYTRKYGKNSRSYKILLLDSKIFYKAIESGGQGCQLNMKIKSSTGNGFLCIARDRALRGLLRKVVSAESCAAKYLLNG